MKSKFNYEGEPWKIRREALRKGKLDLVIWAFGYL